MPGGRRIRQRVDETNYQNWPSAPIPKILGTWIAKDKTKFTVRPILPEDESLMVKFHGLLSERTVYLRYLQPMMLQDRVTHERLAVSATVITIARLALIAEEKPRKRKLTSLE